jgi:hypothetical protein
VLCVIWSNKAPQVLTTWHLCMHALVHSCTWSSHCAAVCLHIKHARLITSGSNSTGNPALTRMLEALGIGQLKDPGPQAVPVLEL